MIKHTYSATESGHVIAVAMGQQLVIYFGEDCFMLSNPSVPQLRDLPTVEGFERDTPEQLLARIRAQLPTAETRSKIEGSLNFSFYRLRARWRDFKKAVMATVKNIN